MQTVPPLVIRTPALALSSCLVPWDSEAFGFPVAQIDALHVTDALLAHAEFRELYRWANVNNVCLISCRLPHQKLSESFFLEEEGFRFIEMVLHPQIENLNHLVLDDQSMAVLPAEVTDLPELTAIAESAFRAERYHVDPRVDADRANVRYGNWVRNCLNNPKQMLLKVMEARELVALFVIEIVESGKAYWHLTAVKPSLQGKGLGLRAWKTMLHYHQLTGVETVETTISARNVRVLNLYSRLGFRFLPPEMTFHYVSNA